MKKMQSESEIIKAAGTYKHSLVRRAAKIRELASNIALAKAGLAPDIKPARLETMNTQLDRATGQQAYESCIYATLRWVLGVTPEIDHENLELDK